MPIITPVNAITSAMRQGYADGFAVKYNSATAVAIASGNFECNRKLYTLDSDITHTMTSLAAGFDFHYVYIDDNVSSPPIPTIIDSTTEPVWDDARRGWYNGDNRLIGVVNSPPASATIDIFSTLNISEKSIKNSLTVGNAIIALNQAPNGAWQTPNTSESDVFLPVNAVAMRLHMQAQDALSLCRAMWRNNEMAALDALPANTPNQFRGYDYFFGGLEGALGASRKVKIAGEPDDDLVLSAWITNYTYAR